ncbi:hypothetical protein HDU93_006825 [Gonapodya sp. JEL0774]|nr:hypothetical protein HDU93_006825 [Gonapodya sp. JEL0774]
MEAALLFCICKRRNGNSGSTGKYGNDSMSSLPLASASSGGYPTPSNSYPPPSDSYPPPSNSYPPPSNSYPPPSNSYPPSSNSYPPPQNSYAPPSQSSYPSSTQASPAVYGGYSPAPSAATIAPVPPVYDQRFPYTKRCVKGYKANGSDELNLEPGDEVRVEKNVEAGWLFGTKVATGASGAFPELVFAEKS